MRVRALDTNGDWSFGNGKGDYKQGNPAVAQNIKTRLNSFVGDCFFDLEAGLDWYGLLGYKDRIALRLAVSSVILNTTEVTGLKQINFNYNAVTRDVSISYKAQTTYSTLTDIYQYSQGL